MRGGQLAVDAPLDALHKLFVDGKTTIVKFNPVNEYIGPVFEKVFAVLSKASPTASS